MAQQLFITATGTDIGKTFVISKICQKLSKENKKFFVIKPVISGFSENDPNTDSAKILKILYKDFNQENLDQISPWRFKAPLSPNIAAKLENKTIDFFQLVKFCQEKILVAKELNQDLLIEGAGGVMTPITNDKTYLDLIIELKIPVILVVGDYLGTISHTLTAIKVIRDSEVEIDSVAMNYKGLLTDRSNFLALKKITNVDIKEIL